MFDIKSNASKYDFRSTINNVIRLLRFHRCLLNFIFTFVECQKLVDNSDEISLFLNAKAVISAS